MEKTEFMSTSIPSLPLFKVGIISDTHINENPSSCRKLKGALKLFAAHKVDMMINCGDIADVHNPEAYKLYRKLINSVFTGTKPEEIFIHAYHDWTSPQEVESSFKVMKETLEIPHEMLDKKSFKGYTFLIIPQNVPMEVLEEKISSAIAENPGKPLFVIDHIPPVGLFHNSTLWGHAARLEVLKKFPPVIHISGHVHGSPYDDANIWQGEFTAVNVGCLSTWAGDFAGSAPESKEASTAVIMEVFPEKIIFRRLSVINGREYAPQSPWCVPLPFDPESAPWNRARRYASSPAPTFAPRAKMKLEYSKTNFNALTLRFSGAEPDVYKYRMVIAQKNHAGVFEEIAQTEVVSNFYKAASYRKKPLEITLDKAYFESRNTYRISAVPENFYGKKGTPLSVEWQAPDLPRSEVLFESASPMEELPFMTELADGVPVKREGDFYFHDTFNARLELPAALWQKVPAGKKVRLIADIRTIQEDESVRSWTLTVRDPGPVENLSPRIHTPYGDCRNRYLAEFATEKSGRYYILIREGLPNKIRFEHLKIEIF